MKRSAHAFLFLLVALLLGSRLPAQAGTRALDDTIVVRLPNQAVMTLLVRDAAQLRQLRNYHLDSLTSQLGSYIKQAETAAKASPSQQVTMTFYPSQDQPGKNLPEQVRITTRKQAPSSTEVFLAKKFNMQSTVDEDGIKTYTFGSDKSKVKVVTDTLKHKPRPIKNTVWLNFDFGLNTLVNEKVNATGGVPSLSTWGSNYLNLGFTYGQNLRNTKRSRMAMTYGLQVAFNNLRLRGNDIWVDNGSATTTLRADNSLNVDDALLRVVTLNVPVMFQYKMRNAKGKTTLTVGAGGFAGYRLASTITTEYERDGSSYDYEDKTSGQLHLNNWQYGLQGEIGFHGLTLVGKYHLNSLFQTDKGPQAQLFSVGLNLIGF